jgi:hypothetical protein
MAQPMAFRGRAMSDLRFAPWFTEASNGAPADRPARPSESIASQIGLVVLMKQARDDQRLLGVITDSTVSENVRWYWIVANGFGRWLHERYVCDWEPVCPRCRMRRWWWTDEEVIQCGTCHPPAPDWGEFWRLLAALTSGLLPRDEQTAVVLSLLETADHAYVANDWPTCQRIIARIRALQYQRSHP